MFLVHNPYIAVNPYKSEYLEKGYDENYADYYGAITAMDAQVFQFQALDLFQLSWSDDFIRLAGYEICYKKKALPTILFSGLQGMLLILILQSDQSAN